MPLRNKFVYTIVPAIDFFNKRENGSKFLVLLQLLDSVKKRR